LPLGFLRLMASAAETCCPLLAVSLSETQSCWQLISNRAMLLPYARGL
jgi:hypothetical protein